MEREGEGREGDDDDNYDKFINMIKRKDTINHTGKCRMI